MRFLIASPPPGERPDAQFVHETARLLHQRGHEVLLVYFNRPPATAELPWYAEAGVRWAFWRRADGVVRRLPELRRIMAGFRPDLAEFHFSATAPGLAVAWSLHVPRRVAWYHSSLEFARSIYPGSRLSFQMHFTLERLARRTATHHVVLSRSSRDEYVRAYGVPAARVTTHALGVDLTGIASFLTGKPATRTAGAVAEPCLVCLSRLARLKGQYLLVQALPDLLPAFPRLRLIFAGPGDPGVLRQLALRLGVADHCEFRGELPRPEAIRLLHRADVALFPSQAEAFGLVTLESMACGTPLIASALGAAGDIVEDGKTGILVRTAAAAAWGQAIAGLLRDSALRSGIAAGAWQKVREYDLPRRVAAYADWLEVTAQQPATAT